MLGGTARSLGRLAARGETGLAARGETGLVSRGERSLVTSSSAEAREALQHVDDRLDRNRDGSKRLDFAIVGPSDIETVNALLYATYYTQEPLTKHLGLCTGHNSIKDMDRMVESMLDKNLTLIAYDRQNNRPVGVAVNNSCHQSELDATLEEELREVQDTRFHSYQAIHHQLRKENEHIFGEIGTTKMFSIKMIGISPEDRGQGVATNLIRRSILLAGCLGFRAIKAEATGKFSKETFQRVGMYPAGSIKYADFQYKGEKVFAGLADTKDTDITFMRKKFFQSALKHIV